MTYKINSNLSANKTSLDGTNTYTWVHLELGAGNYGKDGYSKVAMEKTALRRFTKISSKRNFLDDLKTTSYVINQERQYQVLFQTLDKLMEQQGPFGLFLVNDLVHEYAQYASEALKTYAIKKGYLVTIESFAADFFEPNILKQKAQSYGFKKYSSIHLKNPEVSLFHNELDGSSYLADEDFVVSARESLRNIAKNSQTGLIMFLASHSYNFFPKSEFEELEKPNSIYKLEGSFEHSPYIFPEGHEHRRKDSFVVRVLGD